jgi:hypothetical protein
LVLVRVLNIIQSLSTMRTIGQANELINFKLSALCEVLAPINKG